VPESTPAVEGFEILEKIGRGGMGEVFRAVRVGDGKIVALKIIQPLLADDESFRLRFKRESEVAAAVVDPHVVAVREAGETDDGTLYMAMDLIEGTNLHELIEMSGKLSSEKALSLLEDLAAGLDAVHEAGLIHRDIKPGNLLIETGPPVKGYVTDFGLARAAASNTALTSTGQFLGSIDYIAPEQIEGRPLDARSDIYSLGCVFFHALTGRPPFQKTDARAKMWAHLHEGPPGLEIHGDRELVLLNPVFRRVLAKDPEDRFLSAGDFALAFRAAINGEAVTRKERFVGVGDAARTKTKVLSEEESSTAGSDRKWLAWAGLGIALCLLAATAFLLTNKETVEAPPTKAQTPAKDTSPPEPISPSSPISTQGIGPVLVGMTVKEAERAGDIELHPATDVVDSCRFWESDSVKDVRFLFVNKTMAILGASNKESETLSGVGVGDPESVVTATYGDRISVNPYAYDSQHTNQLTYEPKNPLDHMRIVFWATDGIVTAISAGDEQFVSLNEPCFGE